MKAADVLGLPGSQMLVAEVDRIVVEINPQHCEHQQYRWNSRPAGMSVIDADGTNARSA
ncbi:hypothetical protein [Paraburkholderia sp. J67]|uniref:hypothetical protein n=1 Tax=Paraburkholderia sp. J67 TaxID=2805435 RepID=UPI002ABE9A91|nr:hypothetical protein [Paraburkholderia sp. J67]